MFSVETFKVFAPVAGIIAFICVISCFFNQKVDEGTDRMKKFHLIHEGAMAFLTSEYKYSCICCSIIRSIICFDRMGNSSLFRCRCTFLF